MKKYTAPKMNVNMFDAEMVMMTSSQPATGNEYVGGMPNEIQKAQVNLDKMVKLTKYVF